MFQLEKITRIKKDEEKTAITKQKKPALHHEKHISQNTHPFINQTLHPFIGISPKLTVSSPKDKYEQEADRVADHVLKMKEIDIQTREHPPALFMKSDYPEPIEIDSPLASQVQSLSGGQPLCESERSFFEPRFGIDFGNVRLHTGSGHAKLAESLNARAFTYGEHIVFGKGEYSPTTGAGKQLLAHELAHVRQGGETGFIKVQMKSLDKKNIKKDIIEELGIKFTLMKMTYQEWLDRSRQYINFLNSRITNLPNEMDSFTSKTIIEEMKSLIIDITIMNMLIIADNTIKKNKELSGSFLNVAINLSLKYIKIMKRTETHQYNKFKFRMLSGFGITLATKGLKINDLIVPFITQYEFELQEAVPYGRSCIIKFIVGSGISLGSPFTWYSEPSDWTFFQTKRPVKLENFEGPGRVYGASLIGPKGISFAGFVFPIDTKPVEGLSFYTGRGLDISLSWAYGDWKIKEMREGKTFYIK